MPIYVCSSALKNKFQGKKSNFFCKNGDDSTMKCKKTLSFVQRRPFLKKTQEISLFDAEVQSQVSLFEQRSYGPKYRGVSVGLLGPNQ